MQYAFELQFLSEKRAQMLVCTKCEISRITSTKHREAYTSARKHMNA